MNFAHLTDTTKAEDYVWSDICDGLHLLFRKYVAPIDDRVRVES